MAAKKKVPQVSKASQVSQVPQARDTRGTRTPRGTPTTMEELLRKTGYQVKTLSRGQKIEGTVVEVTPKSLILDVGAKAEGIVAEREFAAARDFIRKLSPGDKVEAQVVVPEAESGQSLLSVQGAAQRYAWERLEEAKNKDQEVEAKVEEVVKGGLSVFVEGIPGFIPGSHLGGDLAQNPQKAVGRGIKTKIIELDREKDRLVLSEKAVSEAGVMKAQEKALKKVKKGEKFRGKVVGLTNFGAFVQINVPSGEQKDDTNLDGLVHLSELAWGKVDSPSSVLEEGQEVDVVVIGKASGPATGSERGPHGPGGGRLALSIKQATEDPWKEASRKYKSDTTVRGKVTKIGDFGAIVELEPGIEGLLHLSKIPAGVSLHEGSEVDLFVEEVDEKSRRVSLGMVLKEKPIGYK